MTERTARTRRAPREASSGARLPTPSIVNRRLLVGVLLVAGSVVGVAVVVSTADDTVAVWAVRSDLAPGVTVNADDVERIQVHLGGAGARYLPGDADPVGRTVARAVATGELLPVAAVPPTSSVERRLVTVPVERFHLAADLQRGELVDIYVVERGATGQPVGGPRLVLSAVTVDSVDDDGSRFGGSSLETGVVVAVAPDDVSALVGASSRGSLTLVRVASR